MKRPGSSVLISGGTSGIGEALAVKLHERGDTVYVCARNEERLAAFSRKYEGIQTRHCDIQNKDDIAKLCAELGDEIDILVNNAGILQEIPLYQDSSLDDQLREVDINLNGMLRMISAFLPGLAKRTNPIIINVTSATSFIPEADAPIYSATKAAQHAFTMCLRHQLKAHGVEVVELIPPLTDTPMAAHVEGIPKISSDRVAEALLKGLARGRTEIAPGMGRIAMLMARLSPVLAFKMLNKSKS